MKNENMEKRVLHYILEHKKTTTTTIVSHFRTLGYTKQGVYKTLRRLHDEGKILWVKTHVEIHLLWLHSEIEKLAQGLPKKEIVFQEFNEKKKTYKVKTLTELENVYGQIFISLISSLQNVKHFLFYDLHNFTYVNTVPIVDWYIDFIFKHHGQICLLVGSQSPLDIDLKKKNRMKEIDIHCINKKWNVCLSVFGDYIIYVHPHKKIMKKMDVIFNTHTESTAQEPLKKLYEEKSTHKIVIEKNRAKALEIEKVFKKYFVLR